MPEILCRFLIRHRVVSQCGESAWTCGRTGKRHQDRWRIGPRGPMPRAGEGVWPRQSCSRSSPWRSSLGVAKGEERVSDLNRCRSRLKTTYHQRPHPLAHRNATPSNNSATETRKPMRARAKNHLPMLSQRGAWESGPYSKCMTPHGHRRALTRAEKYSDRAEH